MSQDFTIQNVTMTGGEDTVTLSATTSSVLFRATGADIDLLKEAASSIVFTISDGSVLALDASTLKSTAFIFKDSTAAATLQVLEIQGPQS